MPQMIPIQREKKKSILRTQRKYPTTVRGILIALWSLSSLVFIIQSSFYKLSLFLTAFLKALV